MRILVVEDDPFVREMAVSGLEDDGFEVIAAADGGQALSLLDTEIAIDALLTDIRMPEADGWEVAKAFRRRFPDLPVIYVTGYSERLDPVTGGVVLPKPYKLSQAISILRTWDT
ncbi:response regulator [Microvirga sp. M2]|uniref:response regulator n=1 Tax=Microvirga sp. M2 TaxID=3073270 RepID=UPI0039C49AD1